MNKIITATLAVSFSIFSNFCSAEASIYIGQDPVHALDRQSKVIAKQYSKLGAGIQEVASISLNSGRVNCTNDRQCKVASIGVCGGQHVLYSTYKSRTIDESIGTMKSVRGALYPLFNRVMPACAYFRPPSAECIKKGYQRLGTCKLRPSYWLTPTR